MNDLIALAALAVAAGALILAAYTFGGRRNG